MDSCHVQSVHGSGEVVVAGRGVVDVVVVVVLDDDEAAGRLGMGRE